MANFLLIFFCMASGMILRFVRRFDERGVVGLNAYLVNIAMPAVALVELRGVPWRELLGWPAGMAWILFAAGCLFFFAVGRWQKWSLPTIGALCLTGALANTSFVGFPLLEAFYGHDAIRIGVLCDQLGSFSVLATVALLVAARCGGGEVSLRGMVGRMLSYPPFVAVILAFVLGRNVIPDFVYDVLRRVGDTLIPMALVSIGMQLRFRGAEWRANASALSWGLGFKLVIGPAIVALVMIGFGGARGFPIQVTLLESAMAPMVMGSILAMESGQNRNLAGLMVLVGIPLSLLTVPIWWWLARGL